MISPVSSLSGGSRSSVEEGSAAGPDRLRWGSAVPTMRAVAVLGLGYAGLPMALAAARAGHDVVGFDVSEKRVSELSGGHSPVDDITDAELA